MPHRAPSPAASENEVDISRALVNDGSSFGSDDESQAQHPDRKARMLVPGEMPDLDGDYSSDDAGFIAETQAASNRKAANLKGKTVKKGGGFQAMGLNPKILKAVARKGFSVPTPIQRKTIPLILDHQDVVGMARTGSGKTAAFVLPMIEKLKSHTAKFGARGLILSPSRELALQTLKVVRELGKGTDLKVVLLVGGESLEEQFSAMAGNPDIIIATPGRFMHLKVEMQLDLSSMIYVVFDEADRLFEMGFAAQLTEILHALPSSRQTLLFSATLPKSLVEFARAGLQEPHLIRLDADSKISQDLQSAFFTMKGEEKEGALLHILGDIIQIPLGQPDAPLLEGQDSKKNNKKRKRPEVDAAKPKTSLTKHSTIIFTATKHHVEYLATLLRQSGFAVSHAYGSLDQTARKIQVQDFTQGKTNILVVTDVAARGIDLPVLSHVVNYDMPSQPKVFIHRVGRTARAGQRGWSYSIVRESDTPYLLDLQLFLGRKLLLGPESHEPNYSDDIVVGSLVRDEVEKSCELVSKLLDEDSDLLALRLVAAKGEKLYLKTRNAASTQSAKRSKDLTGSKDWMSLHPLFKSEKGSAETERANMLSRISGFRPQETVFEIGKRGTNGETVEMMKRRRVTVERKHQALQNAEGENTNNANRDLLKVESASQSPAGDVLLDDQPDMGSASDEELEITFSNASKHKNVQSDGYKDSDFFMSYTPATDQIVQDRGYGVHSGGNSNFLSAARNVTMDFTNDDTAKNFAEPSRAKGMRWDKKGKKYVSRANDEDGSKGKQMIFGESGQKIAASFRSGRYDAWKKSNRIHRLPRAGENETGGNAANIGAGRRFKHKGEKAPKDADKYRDDFHKKRKLVEKAKEERRGRFKDGKGKSEIKGVDDVRKDRGVKERRKEKNARPGKRR